MKDKMKKALEAHRKLNVEVMELIKDAVAARVPLDPLTREAAKAIQVWESGKPVFRHTAAFREASSLAMATREYDWFTEMMYGDPKFADTIDKSPLAAISVWTGWKLRGVSATSNWFRPSPGLVDKLLATELRGLVVGDLKLPLPAFYIELPDKLFYIEDAATGWHPVRMLVVAVGTITEHTVEQYKKNAPDDPSIHLLELGKRVIIEAYGHPNENSTSVFDDSWLFKSYRMENQALPLDTVLESVSQEFDNYEREMNRGRLGESFVFDGIALKKLLMQFLMNFCLYLNSEKATCEHIHEAEIKRLHGGKKFKNLRKPVQEKIQQLRNDRVFAVGTNVVIDPEIRDLVHKGGSGIKLQHRTLVRGHWRNQAHGPKREMRKKMWIEPHIRGAELPTQVVGHNYEVK